MNVLSTDDLCWFSVKMRRAEIAEGEFRPTGGDFEGMGIYRPIELWAAGSRP